MPSHNFDQIDLLEDYEDFDEYENLPKIKNAPGQKQRIRRKDKYNKISEPEVARAIDAQKDDRRALDFTYQASLTERAWLLDSLGRFYEQQWFDDVLRIVKGGKEASVYQCLGNATTGAEFIAAKMYRPRMFRSLKNDYRYRQGRDNLDADGLIIHKEGEIRAINQRTEFGKRLMHTSWIEHEVRALETLHGAGADVPECFASGHNAILMTYVGGPELAAPTLSEVALSPDEARRLFDRTLENVDLMLAHDIVHGDLSAYNILYWEGAITLIDFPQMVDPHRNPDAHAIFTRDVKRVCAYFASFGVDADPARLTAELWSAHGLPPALDVDPSLLDPEDEDDRAYWEANK